MLKFNIYGHKALIVSMFIVITFLSGCNHSDSGENESGNNEPTVLRAVSFNLKNAESNVELWDLRKSAVVEYFVTHKPDVIGVQEADELWTEYLNMQLSDYSLYSVGRDDGANAGESVGIFYNNQKFALIDSGTFWLSDTPEQVSVGWDASTYRISSFVVLEDFVSKKRFAHFNTHLDHKGLNARKNGVELILEKVRSLNLPTLVTGDFNFLERSEVYKTIESNDFIDTKKMATNRDSYSTLNWFIPHFDTGYTIDFIFTQDNFFDVLNYQVSSNETVNYNGEKVPISDHYPVLVDLILK
ncbi:endonuclease/exonuclease/phosphatase family protein [Thalassotalea sp. PP2-459]|uniref:endonuclease/exonuclease/phosphatase family protein n=1 Tax=Thalassotalea sp. PP2-459 TaxID=1742724 RepID=UPI0009422D24|nr:endonuclease/exonuclease/phosphatase family protein [Thalassotalea sp. PP2-459]OKY27815.1 hypothetical protein BI291_07840 [Thalassotalea sp. PP2-459]